MKLLKKIPVQRAIILQVLDKQSKPLTCAEVKQLLPSDQTARADQALYQMYQKEILVRDTSDGTVRYKLSKYGKFLVSNLAKIEQFDSYNDPRALGNRAKKLPVMAPPPPPPTFNLSPTAETISNGISALLVENENYRNLLLKVYNIIGDALQINSKETEQ